jgi:hypothetical protein
MAAVNLPIDFMFLPTLDTLSTEQIASSLLTGNPLRADLLRQQGSQVGAVGTLFTDETSFPPTMSSPFGEEEFSLQSCLIGVGSVEHAVLPRLHSGSSIEQWNKALQPDCHSLIDDVACWLARHRQGGIIEERLATTAQWADNPAFPDASETGPTKFKAVNSPLGTTGRMVVIVAFVVGLVGLFVCSQVVDGKSDCFTSLDVPNNY